jgi:hypothetical protein
LLEAAQRLSPSLVDWYLLGPGQIMDGQRTDRPDDPRENMDRPTDTSARSTGQFGEESKSTSLYTAVFGLHPARGRVAAAAALGAAAVALRRAGRRR